jgi:hypothetical protein
MATAIDNIITKDDSCAVAKGEPPFALSGEGRAKLTPIKSRKAAIQKLKMISRLPKANMGPSARLNFQSKPSFAKNSTDIGMPHEFAIKSIKKPPDREKLRLVEAK